MAQSKGNPMRDSLAQAAQILAYHPDSIDLRLRKAAWNMQLEEWQYAKDEYDFVLAKQPANIAALYYRAYCNDRLHRYNFARLDYQNLLIIIPGNFEARLGLALLDQKDSHYTEALDGINRLVTAFPDSAPGSAARGARSVLKDIEADMLKIDMGFLRQTGNPKRSSVILNAVIAMAKWLGMRVITEGVETKEQVEHLRSLGCDMFQGYFFAKPMPVEEFEAKYFQEASNISALTEAGR